MKLIVLRNNLVESLSSVEHSVGMNANLPILKNILLRAFENKIILTATDLEIATQSTVSGKIIEEGECSIPFLLLNSIVKNIVSERVSINEEGKKITITTDNYEAEIQGNNPKDFPLIPSVHDTTHFFKINSGILHDALSAVSVAVQYSEIRPEISGVLFKYEKDSLVFVGTDSFRLVEKRVLANEIETSFEAVSMIIPKKTTEELLRVLGKSDVSVEIFIDPNQVLFKMPAGQIISRLIDGNFPEYQGVIPKEVENELTVDREEMINAIKLTAAFAGRTQGISMSVKDGKNFLELHSADGALGENRYKVPAKIKGNTFSAIFNWKYILDGLRIYAESEIVIGATPGRPALIRSPRDGSLVYVLMPIKL